ncbi:MAG: sigma-70 family RNA polymerase sigma factor [Pyrinomonadaceae bacterium]|nr:sigma-70 family RNA polymerase sigma factor [Pyrinomonadaceae bacterium]
MPNANFLSFGNLGAVADYDLVASAISGGEDGFEELVRRYQRPIVAYIYRMTGDYEAALDLTQDVFVKVYNSLRRYRSEYKFSTWIYRIAHNVAVDHLRRNSTRERGFESQTSDGESYELPLVSAQPTPEQQSERAERLSEIEEVIDGLPSAYKELIVLRHAHDLSYEEIAEVTGLPLGTVKNRIFRARETMRNGLLLRGITSL